MKIISQTSLIRWCFLRCVSLQNRHGFFDWTIQHLLNDVGSKLVRDLFKLFFLSFNVDHFIRFLEELKQHEHDQFEFISRVQMISLRNQRRRSSWCHFLSRQKVRCIQSFELVRTYQVKHLDCLFKRVKGIIWRLLMLLCMWIFCFRLRRLCIKDAWRLRWNNQVWIVAWCLLFINQKQCICPKVIERLMWSLFCQTWSLFMKRFRLNIMLFLALTLYFKPTMQVQV